MYKHTEHARARLNNVNSPIARATARQSLLVLSSFILCEPPYLTTCRLTLTNLYNCTRVSTYVVMRRLYVIIFACLYVREYVCMYVYMYGCIYLCNYVILYEIMYVRMYLCMNVCM